MEQSEAEEKGDPIMGTSHGTKSEQTEKPLTGRALKLRILQQALYNYRKDGGEYSLVFIEGGMAIVLKGVGIDADNNFVIKGE